MEAEIYAQRRTRLRKELARRGLDALLVSSAPNRFYLSGFELHDPQFNESAGRLIVCADGNDWLATDSRYAEAAARIWPQDRIFIYGHEQARDLAHLLARLGLKIGCEQEAVSAAFLQKLKASPACPPLLPAAGLVEKLRVIKGQEEVAALEKSFALNHRLMAHIESRLAPGLDEAEIAWLIERFFCENGASGLAFASIVAVDKNAALPHALPGADMVRDNSLVLVDAGCRVDNYCSDQTRTFWVGGQKPERYEKTYALVQAAQKAALEIIRPGMALAEVYKAAREVFAQAGQEKYFTHGLGHGVGLETHEAPSLSPRATGCLEEGMTVTVEPGLYYPDWGGVRLEYTVLVVPGGCRIL